VSCYELINSFSCDVVKLINSFSCVETMNLFSCDKLINFFFRNNKHNAVHVYETA
jgi:hypothetical protein